ncbi:hypothetical protein GCM10010842_00660 [Deinococcus daejeonensis]|uniref:Uncharacterized protein n=1 Tax=Deinococcus daejeonensis TaxID=1007098 RepID=A0ABQ2IQW5_9DEIO|nr:hypothetical protein GCM10010842_00660 [Deinococcus daejeonensis]
MSRDDEVAPLAGVPKEPSTPEAGGEQVGEEWAADQRPYRPEEVEHGSWCSCARPPAIHRSYELRLSGLQSPLGPSEASESKTGSGRGAGNPVMFRIAGETNGTRIS